MAATILGVPRARPVVEIGVGDSNNPVGAAQWGVSRWGQTTARWFGQEPYWWDITCDVHDIETFTGHDRVTDSWEVGTATVVVKNETGWADFPPTDPATMATLLSVRPGRQIRVSVAVDGGAPVVRWRGYIDRMEPGYDPNAGDVVTLSCIDGKGEAGRAVVAKLAAPVGANEVVTTRLGRILDAIGWPAYRRDFVPSSARLLATSMGGRAVSLLDLAADSAGGAVYGDTTGRVAFRPRDWRMYPAGQPVDGTIGNTVLPTVPPSLPVPVEDPLGSGLMSWDLSLWVEDPAVSGLFDWVGP